MKQIARLATCVAAFALFVVTAAPQDMSPQSSDLRSDSAAATAEIASFLQQGLPQADLTRVSLYVLNQPKVAIPLLVGEIRGLLANPAVDQPIVDAAAELIAYASSEGSIDAFADLLRLDEQRFLPYVQKTLGYASARQRDFDLAAYAIARYPSLAEVITRWVNRALKHPRADEMFATVVLRSSQSETRSHDGFRRLVDLLEPATRGRYDAAMMKVRAINSRGLGSVQAH